MLTEKIIKKFKENTLRLEVSSRGGGVEISLDKYGFKGERMCAFCKYLGGGLLGRVCVDNTIRAFDKPCTDKQRAKLERIGEQLKQYYHNITNPDEGTWEHQSYEQNQSMSSSGY